MKTNKQLKYSITTILLSIAMASSGSSIAGTKFSKKVIVDYEKSEARGILMDSTARAGSVEDIGCRVETFGINGDQTRIECSATDAQANTMYCISTRPTFAKVAQALPNYGMLWFRIDSTGECTFLQSRVGSPFLP